MSYEFKVYINGGRAYFQWQGDTSLTASKKAVKKDFELSQSLLDFLYLDMDGYFDLFNKIGEEIQNLYEKDSKKNIAFLKDGLNKMVKVHVYFELLRLDWFDRLDKYVMGECASPQGAMPYKEITHIPMNIITWQNQVRTIFTKVLDVMSPDKPIQQKMSELYEGKDAGSLALFDFQSLSTAFERIDGQTFAEVLNPKSIGDLIDFLLRGIISRELTFKVCKSCGKYFPTTVHGNSEYCNRLFQDTGKTCKEIGSVKVYQAKVAENPEYKAYNKAYKTHFARIKYKRMTKEDFQAWAELAREFRDKVTAGDMTLDEYQEWLKR